MSLEVPNSIPKDVEANFVLGRDEEDASSIVGQDRGREYVQSSESHTGYSSDEGMSNSLSQSQPDSPHSLPPSSSRPVATTFIESVPPLKLPNEHQISDPSEPDPPIALANDDPDVEEDEGGSEFSDGSADEPSSESESEEDDSEVEEEEPALKYEIVGGAVQDILAKDSASALDISQRLMALGTHNGMVHVLDLHGNKVKSYRPHSATINQLVIDSDGEFIATVSVDGTVVIHALTTPEVYKFDFKRQMRTISLEPSFSRRNSRSFVCGGMAGKLELHEKSWLGHRETVLHSGEGPIWTSSWSGTLIVWANDVDVKIYDTGSAQRVAHIDRPSDSPRADLYKCTLQWRDDTTLLIAWADYVKIARVKPRTGAAAAKSPYVVEIAAIFHVDCMISGIAPHPSPPGSFIILSYIVPDKIINEVTSSREEQRRKAAHRPELRIISRAGEEISNDVLALAGYELYSCNDYSLRPAFVGISEGTNPLEGFYVVASPKSVTVVKPRDEVDHVQWLVEHQRFAEALSEIQRLEKTGAVRGLDATDVGKKYIRHLFQQGEYLLAAQLCPKVFGQDAQSWEEEVFRFLGKGQLQAIIPYIPTSQPQLGRMVYEVILAHYLAQDQEALLRTLKEWPVGIFDIPAVINAVRSELERIPSSPILMDCMAELYIMNRQPTLALPFFLRRRRPGVFDLIRDHNLFTAVRDQALLLVEFDEDLERQRRQETGEAEQFGEKGRPLKTSKSISLLVDHVHSIPIARVFQQLQGRPYFLYLYLDALFDKDPLLVSEHADRQIPLYAEFAPKRLIDFLRASQYYSLEKAYQVCTIRDMVPEMVYLLGRMGNNKKALNLIIERLGDVNRAIDFAKDQRDNDLWEDLLTYSETRPAFIRGLLENVGPEIDPIRLIRRIKNGLEIPGLKDALIKILWDFNLQISLMEGCQRILNVDGSGLSERLQTKQVSGFLGGPTQICPICHELLYPSPQLSSLNINPPTSQSQPLVIVFLCRHAVHAHCIRGGSALPRRADDTVLSFLRIDQNAPAFGGGAPMRDSISSKIAYATMVRARLEESCPVCDHRRT
ncbi:uncharacterized protein EI90DRAFT_3279515 [Cantharellus anzutake]|uniref:uncharacterized protein n=1 Tax=Cantharellus anzutake TaxID=1750568 RepID=UPI001906F9B5|nr:uncharacterized protein EI90DRAFT_3279515 [Cantharellus anzutake]KAF8339185.1 hypothetical protein EI90DRAFT_3279515 [Cantharellus anzutake]